MRQRLGLAQAIAGNPRLIIVDEPTAGLDPEERLRFYYLLAALAQDRIVLLSTHIVEDVAVLCTRFAIIRHGRLVAQTSPSEALDRLQRRDLRSDRQRRRVRNAAPVALRDAGGAVRRQESRARLRDQRQPAQRIRRRPCRRWKMPTCSRCRAIYECAATRFAERGHTRCHRHRDA